MSTAATSSTVELPMDILDRLPDAFKTSDELRSVLSTCKTVYQGKGVTCHDSDILYHLATSPHAGFQPHPHLLTGLKARELANWVVQDLGSREPQLQESIQKGPDALLDLAISISPLMVDDIVRLYDILTNLIVPVSEELDMIEGITSTWPSRESIQEYKIAHPGEALPRHPEYPEELTILQNVTRAMANHWIYCDLFHHTVFNAFARPSPTLPELSSMTRLMWISVCVPDCNDHSTFSRRHGLDQTDVRYLDMTLGCHMFLARALTAGRPNYRDFASYMESAGLDTFRLCALKKRYFPTGESRAVLDAINERMGNPPIPENLALDDDADEVWEISPRVIRIQYTQISLDGDYDDDIQEVVDFGSEGGEEHDAENTHLAESSYFVDDSGEDVWDADKTEWRGFVPDICFIGRRYPFEEDITD